MEGLGVILNEPTHTDGGSSPLRTATELDQRYSPRSGLNPQTARRSTAARSALHHLTSGYWPAFALLLADFRPALRVVFATAFLNLRAVLAMPRISLRSSTATYLREGRSIYDAQRLT